MLHIRHSGPRWIAGVSVVALSLLSATSAQASLAQPTVVSDNPANFTPDVPTGLGSSDGTILKYAQVGGTMYAGGQIGTVTNAARTVTYNRANIMAFNADTGAMTSWAPQLNKRVNALLASDDSRYLFVGGDFTTLNGGATHSLLKFDLTTGARVSSFSFAPKGAVNDLEMVGGHLLVGGSYPGGLLSVDPTTGAADGWLNVQLSGKSEDTAPTKTYRFAVNPAGTKLVVVGNFTEANLLPRRQAFMVDLDGAGGVVTSWHPSVFDRTCNPNILFWTRAVDFSPDGSYFVIAASGGGRTGSVCDAVSRWAASGTGSATPTWVNYTGKDSMFSVAATGVAVYVGGHFRWLDNVAALDEQGPGAVTRNGIGAIDPVTGKALPWNPGKTRGHGTEELYTTPEGLWLGSDGRYVHGEYREGVAFMPLP